MPFTVSHAAATLPFARRGLLPSALIIGSMVPDFEFFFRISLAGERFAHSLLGVLLFCFPVGFCSLLFYHRVLKAPLLSLLPDLHRRRIAPYAGEFKIRSASDLGLVLSSLAVGILTHLVWDAFTHSVGWSGTAHAILTYPCIRTGWGNLDLSQVLHHLSTIVGGVVLVRWYLTWVPVRFPRRRALKLWLPDVNQGIVLCMMLLAATVVAVMHGLAGAANPFGSPDELHTFGSRAIVSGLTALLVQMTLFSVVWHVGHNRMARIRITAWMRG